MDAQIIGYIIIVVLSILVGICGTAVYIERKSAKDLREHNSDTERSYTEVQNRTEDALNTIAEIRKNGQTKE